MGNINQNEDYRQEDIFQLLKAYSCLRNGTQEQIMGYIKLVLFFTLVVDW